MLSDAIERDILIEAPVDVVWKTITEPDLITRWFSDQIDLDLRPGGVGTLRFETTPTGEPVIAPLTVVTVEPPHRFAFRWDHPAGTTPDPANSLLVEFTLTDEDGNTRLRLVESGYLTRQRPEAETAAQLADHREGWDSHLVRLRTTVGAGH